MKSQGVLLAGTGLFLPADVIDNAELAGSFNAYVQSTGAPGPAQRIADETAIEKAAGVSSRHVVDKAGVLDRTRMRPRLRSRPPSALSLQAELAVAAARQALARSAWEAEQIDLTVVASTALERAYPAVAIEVQHALGARGFAFDLSAACSSATFALQVAVNAVRCGTARAALVISAEIPSAQVDFRDPRTHFIFGDGAAAAIVRLDEGASSGGFRVLGVDAATEFSNSIRNDFGFLIRCEDDFDESRAYFRQNGVRVMRDVVPMATRHILGHLDRLQVPASRVRRLWLHQANSHINRLIARKVLGDQADDAAAPSILADCGNLASAGSLAAFHRHHDDLAPGAVGVLCSFGAGYSVGSLVIEKGNPP